MKYKIFLSDFDGTFVYEDILDVVCGINNKYEESKKINEGIISGKISGLNYIKQRIDFLEGVTNEQIKELLDKEETRRGE
jgi:2-hydroxy-3-keto-5-methylthiopentenyl-1-phosphate phosphatase